MNRKEFTREQEEPMIYYTLINTQARRAKRDKKYGYDMDWPQKRAYNMVPQM